MRPLEKNKTYPPSSRATRPRAWALPASTGQVVFVSGAIGGKKRCADTEGAEKCGLGKMFPGASPPLTGGSRLPLLLPACGGCVYRHMDYAEELFAKRQRCRMPCAGWEAAIVAWRKISAQRIPCATATKANIPCHRRAQWLLPGQNPSVTDIDRCLIQKEQADAAAGACAVYAGSGVAGYDEKDRRRAGAAFVCAYQSGRGEPDLRAGKRKKLPCEQKLVELLRQAVPSAVGVLLG